MAEASDVSRSAYDRWSHVYDQQANSTVAVDEAHFPRVWRHLTGQRVPGEIHGPGDRPRATAGELRPH